MSKTLAEDMAGHLLAPPKRVHDSICWFAHLVPVIGGHCTMLMEAETRYCMVFHNLTASDFDRFPVIFENRLTREVLALCQTKGNGSKRLTELVKKNCRESQFGMGLDYSISADVYDAARHLQAVVEELGGYPVVGVTEFGLGIKLNQQVLPHLSEEKATTALDAFRDLWLHKLRPAFTGSFG